METTTILLTVAVLILCAVPIVLAQRNKAKKEEEIKKTFSKLAGNSTSIDQFDRWNKKALAIDNVSNKLFFISGKDGGAPKVIDLAAIQQASLIKSHHNGGSENSGIKKVELYLVPKEKGQPNVELEFYDAEHDSLTIRDELQLAEKWSAILQSAISKSKEVK
jgi:hypothetical protein